MKKFFKVILTILFWQSLFFLTVFYIPDKYAEKYYPIWLVSFFIFFIFITFLSVKLIPSSKDEKLFKKVLEEYADIEKIEEDIRTEALRLEYSCPSCKSKNTFWSFLFDYKCVKCGSELWTSDLSKYDEIYDNLFKKREKIHSFYNKLKPSIKNKLKKHKVSEFLK